MLNRSGDDLGNHGTPVAAPAPPERRSSIRHHTWRAARAPGTLPRRR